MQILAITIIVCFSGVIIALSYGLFFDIIPNWFRKRKKSQRNIQTEGKTISDTGEEITPVFGTPKFMISDLEKRIHKTSNEELISMIEKSNPNCIADIGWTVYCIREITIRRSK